MAESDNMVVTLVSYASLSITIHNYSGTPFAGIIRLVSLWSSLRALDSAGERLVLGELADWETEDSYDLDADSICGFL